MDKYGFSNNIGSSGVISEIQEEEEHSITDSNNHNISSPHAYYYAAGSSSTEEEEECVYVCVGKGDTSMEALSWALNNLVKQDQSSTTVYLIHVFPQVKHIPNPLGAGMVAKSKVSGELVERYMAQERANRRDLLHNLIQSCSSFKVKVETILIESDFIAKAILDLIPILHITNLVIGATKNHHPLIRKSSSRKWNGSIADQIEQNAPESCKLRIICEGKEQQQQQVVLNQMPTNSPHPPPTPQDHDPDPDPDDTTSISNNKQQHHRHNGDGDDHDDFPSCICFKPKFR